VDAVRKTIELPPHRKERLLDVFKAKGSSVSKKSWQSLLGELRFASIGPSSRGLFCILQLALSKSDKGVRVTPAVKSHLESFERLVRDLTERPTRLGEIIPDHLARRAHDAGIGMGGVYFTRPRPCRLAPTVLGLDRANLVTFENPKGPVNNSDLEQAGGLGSWTS
jgi:hypothetical protein